MKEISEIVKAYHASLSTGRKAALATVVHVEGSSYRRAGARMLVDDEGHMTGAISGGCLEGDALRKAQLVIAKGQPAIVVYDTSDEDDATIGVQLGCAGVIHVLFEPMGVSHPIIAWFEQLMATRAASVLMTIYPQDRTQKPLGAAMLMKADGTMEHAMPASLLQSSRDIALRTMAEGRSIHLPVEHEGSMQMVFAEYIPPPVSLVVVGAGNDAIPLVQMGTELGWDVRVVDGRSTHARPERFTGACQVLVRKPEQVLEGMEVDDRTFFVLMTHNYRYDLAMLKALVYTKAAYIGVLGPRKKLERMLDELRQEGMVITEEMMERIYGPVGLELGAETSSEIALSVTAEILRLVRGGTGASLRTRTEPIHAKQD
jgi:xanthine dehydrogenase accessory factor